MDNMVVINFMFKNSEQRYILFRNNFLNSEKYCSFFTGKEESNYNNYTYFTKLNNTFRPIHTIKNN
jgi:hypothetical protein